MRNSEKLNNFYDEVKRIHKTYLPDWRAGQFWLKFFEWLQYEKKRDGFFPEEDELLRYLKEYCGEK